MAAVAKAAEDGIAKRPEGWVLIYLLTCHPTGKQYVGITKRQGYRRWAEHRNDANRNQTRYISRAIKKYGRSSFSFTEVAFAGTWEDACIIERALIEQYATRAPCGYNLTEGGQGAVKRVITDEFRKKISAARRALLADPERSAQLRARIGTAHRGKVVSTETRAKQSESARRHPPNVPKGTKRSAATKLRISAVQRGRKLSLSHIEAMRVAGKRAWDRMSPEIRLKCLANLRNGRKSADG